MESWNVGTLTSLEVGRVGRIWILRSDLRRNSSGPDSIKDLIAIKKSFIGRYKKENNIVDVKVVIAKKLNFSQTEILKSSISKSLGKNVALSVEVDEKIIGGIKLQVEDTYLDGSIINQLQRLQTELLQI